MHITWGHLLGKFESIRMVDSKAIRKVHVIFDHPSYVSFEGHLDTKLKLCFSQKPPIKAKFYVSFQVLGNENLLT